MRRGVTNLVGACQGADFGPAVFRAETRICVTVAEDLLFAVMGCNGVWKAAALFIHNSRTATGGTGFEFWRASLPNVKITKTHIIWSITGQDSIVKFTKMRLRLPPFWPEVISRLNVRCPIESAKLHPDLNAFLRHVARPVSCHRRGAGRFPEPANRRLPPRFPLP